LAAPEAGGADAPVTQLDCTPGDAGQVWQWAAIGGGKQLQEATSHRCLRVQTKAGQPPRAAAILQSPCGDGLDWQWKAAKINDQADIIVSGLAGGGDAAQGWCLDIDGGGTAAGTKAILWACHKGPSQQWRLVPR
jgi:hypothetical protein